MKELIPYIFEHPQYGKLRVVVEEDRIYYAAACVLRGFGDSL
jgi:type IV secretory pathway TrbF-like protein